MFAPIKVLVCEHDLSCNAPNEHCSCTKEFYFEQERFQYVVTSLLAVMSGIIGAVIGYKFSMVALTDSLHAFSDGFADLWAALVINKIRKKPHKENSLRRNGTRVIAIMLAIAAIVILKEVSDRFSGDDYIVSPLWIFIAGFMTSMIDLLRVFILSIAQSFRSNDMRAGLIWHAVLDLRRSELVMLMGVFVLTGQFISFLFSVDISWHIRITDMLISGGLAIFMLYIAKLMWQGKHSHRHQKLHFERWLIRSLFGIELPNFNHHH